MLVHFCFSSHFSLIRCSFHVDATTYCMIQSSFFKFAKFAGRFIKGIEQSIMQYWFKGRYKTGGTGQLYDGFPDCEWKMNTP
jgi:hypothetical protein